VNFYYSQEGQPVGPISKDQFESLARLGVIGPRTFVRKEGLEDWQPYEEFELRVPPEKAEVSGPGPAGDFDTKRLELALAKAAAAARSQAEGAVPHPPSPGPETASPPIEGPDPLPPGAVRTSAMLARRAAAKLLDALMLGLWMGMIQVPLLGFWMDAIVLPANLMGLLVSGFLYTFGFTALWGATPGKKILGLKIVKADGSPISRARAFQRALAEVLVLATLGLGYLAAAADSEKRSLMDRLAQTRVV